MASDAFTGDDGTALATHDENWKSMSGYDVAYSELQGGLCQATANWMQQGAYYDGSTENRSKITAKGVSTTGYTKSPHVRAGAATKGYSFVLVPSGSNWVGVAIYKNGTYAAEGGLFSIPISEDVDLEITAPGTSTVTVTAYVNGTSRLSWDDSSSPIGTGHPGFSVAAGSGDKTQTTIDTWTDGAASSPAAAAPCLVPLLGVG